MCVQVAKRIARNGTELTDDRPRDHPVDGPGHYGNGDGLHELRVDWFGGFINQTCAADNRVTWDMG